ncbi:type VI secretion system lipoprotein TssJ [Endozoicomonas numazuensis]|uniref:type VI secretion system lipoprotein TssJ n=1 Tax=Endozoicomonas numazuensis TaxID=1137799 RepID=UPI000ADCE552|nr:type VI secretion system lipoprotein TssJ [Endozoicomonas numazuensis]
MIFTKPIKLLTSLVFIALITGCSTSREVLNFDTSAELSLQAASDVNLDSDGRPSPLVIRIFKLSDARQFEREDFLTLYEQAEDRLGKDLIGTVQLKELAPGENRLETFELTPDIRYLGILAEYSRYDETTTMLVLPVSAHYSNDFSLIASEKGLSEQQ